MTTSKAPENQPDHNDIHRVVKAEKFILVDPQGNERVAMRTSADGRAVLTMNDSAGHLRLSLVVTDDESTVNIFTREEPFHGEPDHDNVAQRIRLGCLSASPEYIEMFKANYHNPELRLFDGEGRERVLLESYASGDGHLGYFRDDGANLLALQKDGLLVWDEESGEQVYYTLEGRKGEGRAAEAGALSPAQEKALRVFRIVLDSALHTGDEAMLDRMLAAAGIDESDNQTNEPGQ